jgi:uncharacterized protein
MATVTVEGTAFRDVEPDRVRVTLGLEISAAEVGPAVDELARRSAVLDAVLDDLHEDVLARRPSSLRVVPRYHYGDREPKLVGQTAQRTVVVELRSGGQVGSLLARVATELGVRVLAVDWLVDPDNAAHHQLRALAVADARARAAVYAEAAGQTLGALSWLAEPGLEPAPPDRPLSQRFEAALARADGAGPGQDSPLVLDLRPDPVRLGVAVHAEYALIEP